MGSPFAFLGRRRGGGAAESRRQEALAGLAQRALEGAEVKDLLVNATALAARILDVPYSAVLAWEPDAPTLTMPAGVGWRAGVVGRLRFDARTHPAADEAWRGFEPVVFERLAREPRMADIPWLRGHEIASGLSVVIAPRGQAYGALAVYSATRRRFDTAEIEFVRGMARLLAIAIGREYGERALFEEMQATTVLAHAGRELMACTDMTALPGRVCELTAQALHCDHSVTWMRGAGEEGFRPLAAAGLPSAEREALEAVVLPPDAVAPLLAELADREAVRLVVPNERHPLLSAVLGARGIRCAVVAPLLKGEYVFGLQISGHRDRAGELGGNHERVAHGIAQLASLAFMNARVVDELERASQVKSEFVSTMSHELRTPLNIIIGYTDMLRDAASPEEQAPLLAHVRKASHELLEMIDGTLNLNRLAAGGDVARFAPVSLAELWRELATDFAALTQRSEVALRWPAPADLAVHTDRRKLKIVLKNLVGNGLKFTPAGEIVTSYEQVGDQCRFTVRDTGIGIAADALPHIFEMFRQVDGSETRSYNGAGLGLYIVKSLLAQLGGQVQAESVVGQGSVFTVVLPIEQPVGVPAPAEGNGVPWLPAREAAPFGPDGTGAAVPAEPEATECALHAPRRVLFADDLPLNRFLIRRFVTREFPFVEMLEACDGEQAVAMFETHRPHLVVLDLHMPEVDGWQAAQRIRQCEGGREIPILALSVDASPAAEAQTVRAGFKEFIAKPISDYSALKTRLEFWLGPRDFRGRPVTPAPSPTCAVCRGDAKPEATAAA